MRPPAGIVWVSKLTCSRGLDCFISSRIHCRASPRPFGRSGSDSVFRVRKLDELRQELLQAFFGDRGDQLLDAGVELSSRRGPLGRRRRRCRRRGLRGRRGLRPCRRSGPHHRTQHRRRRKTTPHRHDTLQIGRGRRAFRWCRVPEVLLHSAGQPCVARARGCRARTFSVTRPSNLFESSGATVSHTRSV